MQKLLTVVVCGLVMTSCATILNKKTYIMPVSSNIEPAKVKVYDQVYELPADVEVTRSNKDLNMILIADSVNIEYTIKPRLSAKFLYMNLAGELAAPINYAVDLTNHKRFYYGNKVFLNTADTLRIYEGSMAIKQRRYFGKEFRKNKGDIFFRVSIPALNSFVLKPSQEPIKDRTGIFGISLGFDYYYKTNQYVSTSGTYAASKTPPPFGDFENIESAYWSLSNNHKWNRWNLGYGISYSHNMWKFDNSGYDIDVDSPDHISITKTSYALGLVFPTSFQLNKLFSFGLTYRPSFYHLGSNQKVEYEHLISLEAILKLPIRQSKSS